MTGKKKERIWFDNRELYRFFRDYKIKELHKPHRTGHLSPYTITRDALGIDQRKQRIRLLAPFMGDQYAQRLDYLHSSLERFLRTSMPINRLSALINETFFYFERFMYMNVKWEKGESAFYRDHALHPAGESFMGYELLKMCPQLEKRLKDFLSGNTPITRYLFDNCRVGLTPENLTPIVYRTWFLASLFHDLGYVLKFYRDNRSRMLSFQRYSDLIFRSNRSSFDDIQLLLSNSLLFNTVDHKTLETCYDKNRHGTYSAFLLLATFYSPPAFDGVDPIDRTAIELAARAIFFHDNVDEDGVELKKDSHDPDKGPHPKKNAEYKKFGDYTNQFVRIAKQPGNDKCWLTDLEKFFGQEKYGILKRSFRIDVQVDDAKNEYVSRRESMEVDPFAFYLRFIDELHVFGRNSLITQNDHPQDSQQDGAEEPNESPGSYLMPRFRNLIPFPAQILCYDTLTNKLEVNYIADEYLFSEVIDGKKNKFFNDKYEKEDRNWSKYFLKELFWLKQCVTDCGIFGDIDFYFSEFRQGRDKLGHS